MMFDILGVPRINKDEDMYDGRICAALPLHHGNFQYSKESGI